MTKILLYFIIGLLLATTGFGAYSNTGAQVQNNLVIRSEFNLQERAQLFDEVWNKNQIRFENVSANHTIFFESLDTPDERYEITIEKPARFLGFSVIAKEIIEVDGDGKIIRERVNAWQRFMNIGFVKED